MFRPPSGGFCFSRLLLISALVRHWPRKKGCPRKKGSRTQKKENPAEAGFPDVISPKGSDPGSDPRFDLMIHPVVLPSDHRLCPRAFRHTRSSRNLTRESLFYDALLTSPRPVAITPDRGAETLPQQSSAFAASLTACLATLEVLPTHESIICQ